MFSRSALLILILATGCPLGQAAGNGCGKLHPKLDFQYAADGTKLIYHVPDVHGISAAWLEVWDRPKRLFRSQVPLKTDGQKLWPAEATYPMSRDTLGLSIYDADIPMFCIDTPCSGPTFGHNVSLIEAGNTSGESLGNAKLEGLLIRLEEGSDSTEVIATGRDLPRDVKVMLVEREHRQEKTRWVFREYLNAEVIDLRNVKVSISRGYLLKPTVLGLIAEDVATDLGAEELSKLLPEQEIVVASKDSPVVDSIEPSTVRADAAEKKDVPVTLRGSGFTQQSHVLFDSEHALEMSIDGEDTEFISSHEIRAQIPSFLLTEGGLYASSDPVRLRVTDDDDLKISEPQDIAVLPTRKLRIAPKAAAINSIAPFPVPLMDAHSPRYLVLEIDGENFRADDRVVAALDISQPFDGVRLKTEFISESRLRAWLPRELWRKHRLSYRLLLQTAAGVCATEVFDEEE